MPPIVFSLRSRTVRDVMFPIARGRVPPIDLLATRRLPSFCKEEMHSGSEACHVVSRQGQRLQLASATSKLHSDSGRDRLRLFMLRTMDSRLVLLPTQVGIGPPLLF